MVFSTYIFIFAFLPFVLCVYFLLAKVNNVKYQHGFLVLASLFFYGYFNWTYLLIILSSIFVNYLLAKLMELKENKKKLFFILGIIFNIGLLGYFKYYDFFIENINTVFRVGFTLKHLVLPLGISFFTFQQFSFIVSIYKGNESVENIVDYALFVTFFPQLIAGPIVTYSEMMPQFKTTINRFFSIDSFVLGIRIFVVGLFRKLVLADTLSLFVENGYGMVEQMTTLSSLLLILAYTLQLYFDFCGYSEMAIGLGHMFNIKLPINFDKPYLSKSVTEFWHRWHKTLGRALSSFVYIPLGGNRKGKWQTYRNLLLTFFISGLWHGAAWTFIIWGVLHGLVSVLERMNNDLLNKIPEKLRLLGTFAFVNIAWVFFRAETFSDVLSVFKGLLNYSGNHMYLINQMVANGIMQFPTFFNLIYLLGFICIGLIIVFKLDKRADVVSYKPLSKINLLYCTLLFVVSIVHLSRSTVFIYFNF